MLSVVYRNREITQCDKHHAEPNADDKGMDSVSISTRNVAPLSPELFYPQVTEQEREMWTHWLPSTRLFDCVTMFTPERVLSVLDKLEAPPEVLEEFQWAWKTELFESYEVRTPVRRDVRDPLLLGGHGGKTYRIALWGESLRPLEEIATLVQRSLVIKERAMKGRLWWPLGGTLLGFLLGLYLGSLAPGSIPLGSGAFFAVVGLTISWLPTILYTPENRQHDFLDRYRC